MSHSTPTRIPSPAPSPARAGRLFSGFPRTIAAGLLLALGGLCGLNPAAALVPSDGPAGGGAGFSLSTDLVGTLPTLWVEDDLAFAEGPLGQVFEMFYSQVSFEAFVPEDELDDLIVSADGLGMALLSPTGATVAGEPLVRLRVLGQIELRIDLDTADNIGVITQSNIGSAFADGDLQWKTAFQASPPLPVARFGSVVALDMQSSAGLSLLTAGPLELSTTHANGDTAGAIARVEGSVVRYTQTL